MREASASLCAHALLANDKTVIQDARNDDRFHDNPRVTGPPGIRFHAGRPLAAPNGLTASTRDRANSAPAHSPGSPATIHRAVER
ncbi:GAF domain-containing protein, partial [Paraburkholderia sp. SIMBA_049]